MLDSHLSCLFLRSKNQILPHPLNGILTALLIPNIWRNPRLTKFSLLSEISFLIWSQPWNTANQKGSGWGSCGQLRWEWLMKHSPKYSHTASVQYEYFKCKDVTKKAFKIYILIMEKIVKKHITHHFLVLFFPPLGV